MCVLMRILLHRATAILLTATVLACPLVCDSGLASVRGDDSGGARCCECCRVHESRSSTGKHSCPTHDSSPGSGGSCQCLCNGALVGDVVANTVTIDTSWSLPVAIIDSLLVDIQIAGFNSFLAAPWPDVGIYSGREMCCLYCTLQC